MKRGKILELSPLFLWSMYFENPDLTLLFDLALTTSSAFLESNNKKRERCYRPAIIRNSLGSVSFQGFNTFL